MFNDLNEFIAALDKARELARVTDSVNPDLESAAVTDRVSKAPGGGPALLFGRPPAFDLPAAVHLFGPRAPASLAPGPLDAWRCSDWPDPLSSSCLP